MANTTTKSTQTANRAKARVTRRRGRAAGGTGIDAGTPTAEAQVARIAALFQAATAADAAEDQSLGKVNPSLAKSLGIDDSQPPALPKELQAIQAVLSDPNNHLGLSKPQLAQIASAILPIFAPRGSLTLYTLEQQIQTELDPASSARDTAGEAQDLLLDAQELGLSALQFVMTRDQSFDDLFDRLRQILNGGPTDLGSGEYLTQSVVAAKSKVPNPMRISLQELADLEARERAPQSKGNGSGPRTPPGGGGGGGGVGATGAGGGGGGLTVQQLEVNLKSATENAFQQTTDQAFDQAWIADVKPILDVLHQQHGANIEPLKHLHAYWAALPSKDRKKHSDEQKIQKDSHTAVKQVIASVTS